MRKVTIRRLNSAGKTTGRPLIVYRPRAATVKTARNNNPLLKGRSETDISIMLNYVLSSLRPAAPIISVLVFSTAPRCVLTSNTDRRGTECY